MMQDDPKLFTSFKQIMTEKLRQLGQTGTNGHYKLNFEQDFFSVSLKNSNSNRTLRSRNVECCELSECDECNISK